MANATIHIFESMCIFENLKISQKCDVKSWVLESTPGIFNYLIEFSI